MGARGPAPGDRARVVVACSLSLLGACGAPRVAAPAKLDEPAKLSGAILLALPGNGAPLAVHGAEREVVRGRVRWRLDDDGGATRANDVSTSAAIEALALPPWLTTRGATSAAGAASAPVETLVLTSAGVLIAVARAAAPRDFELRAVGSGVFASPSFGAREVWLRRGGVSGEWARYDPARGAIERASAPLAAPLLTPWSTTATAGPEFVSPSVAYALVDLLGPVVTHDGGETWTTIALPPPSDRLVTSIARDPAPSFARDGERLVLTPSAILAGERAPPTVGELAAVETTNLEARAIFGVPLDGDAVLFVDGGRLVTATIPRFARTASDGATFGPPAVRVVRVDRIADVSSCVLAAASASARAADSTLRAVAFCTQSEGAGGARKVAGRIVATAGDGAAFAFVAERSFSPFAGGRASASGAFMVGAPCSGASERGAEVLSAANSCVRDALGRWRDVSLGHPSERLSVAPLADGSVALVRASSSDHWQLLHIAATDAGVAQPASPTHAGGGPVLDEFATLDTLSITRPPRATLLSFDETAAGAIVLHRVLQPAGPVASQVVESIEIDLRKSRPSRVAYRTSPPFAVDAIVGAFADRVLIATLLSGPPAAESADAPGAPVARRPIAAPTAHKPKPGQRVGPTWITRDAGAHWESSAWPASAPPLDVDPSLRSTECGPLGCHLYGWSRIGWDTAIVRADRVVDESLAPALVDAPPPPTPASELVARCTIATPSVSLAPVLVPTDRGVRMFDRFAPSSIGFTLGAPPVVRAGDVERRFAFMHGAARGGAIVTAPATGAWGDRAHVVFRFASDLDALEVVHESAVIPAPFTEIQGAHAQLFATPLAVGRLLVTVCDAGRCDLTYRVQPGLPPERIDLTAGASPIESVERIVNARELGGTLFITGSAYAREGGGRPASPQTPHARDPRPFVAIVAGASTSTSSASTIVASFLARSGGSDESSAAASVDIARGRFGLLEASSLPIAAAGTTYLLPFDAEARPAGGFLVYPASRADLSRPTEPCAPLDVAWDFAEQNRRRVLRVDVGGAELARLEGEGGALRARVGEHGVCLDRLTVVSTTGAFQLDPTTGDAVLMTIETAAPPRPAPVAPTTLKRPTSPTPPTPPKPSKRPTPPSPPAKPVATAAPPTPIQTATRVGLRCTVEWK